MPASRSQEGNARRGEAKPATPLRERRREGEAIKAMTLIKILGAAAGRSAAAGAAGRGSGLLAGAASLLGAAAGGKGRGSGGGGGRACGSGILSALSGLAAADSAGGGRRIGAGRGSGKGRCSGSGRRQAPDAPSAAESPLNEGAARAAAEAEDVQARRKTVEDMPAERAKALRFLASCIVSSTRGRVRLRSQTFEGSPALEEMRLASAGVPGVKTAEASFRTGSLLATWDEGQASLERFLAAMADLPAVRNAATGG